MSEDNPGAENAERLESEKHEQDNNGPKGPEHLCHAAVFAAGPFGGHLGNGQEIRLARSGAKHEV